MGRREAPLDKTKIVEMDRLSVRRPGKSRRLLTAPFRRAACARRLNGRIEPLYTPI
jgi:hypothetical protein